MVKRPPKPDAPRPPAEGGLPSREEVLAFIAREGERGTKVGKREIARAFGLGAAERIGLKRLLKDLEAEGHVDRRRRIVHRAGELPPVVLADVVARDPDGDLIAQPVEWDEAEQGAAPRILIASSARRLRPGETAPTLGDRALVRIEKAGETEGPAYMGRVIKVLPRAKAASLGVYRALPGGGGRIVPVDRKAKGAELQVAPGDEGQAQDGDLVSVSVTRDRRYGLPMAKIRERLGSLKSERAVSLIAIHAHAIPHVFAPSILEEAAGARTVGLAGREDWRDIPLVTIDPADARDHDDAVHAAPDPDPDNPGGFILAVAIADVAAYVRPGSPLDREALERGNSVYFPDRVVPMLPERISNDLCSLRPLEDRPALAVRIVIDSEGRKRRHGFHRVMMRSAGKLAYVQAQDAIDGRADDVSGPLLEPALRPLFAAYDALKRAREARQPLDLDLPERKLRLDEKGHVLGVSVPPRLEAHRLIEEFMILANVCAAETLEKAGSALIYRVHDEPSPEKMRALGEVLASIDIKLPSQGALRPALFNRILARVRDTQFQHLVNEVVLRTQAQAEYAAENYGHFGLALRRYGHFTSPIRRYADLVVHRALITALKLGEDGLPAATSREQLAEVAARISAAERRAMAAERETTDRLIAFHLADRVGATFDGRIGGVTKAGLFVTLDETGASGFVPAATLGAEYFHYDEPGHALVGERTGETFRLGDPVSVQLVEAAPMAGALRFEMLSEGRKGAPASRSRGRPGRRAGPGPAERARASAKPRTRRR